MSFDQSKTLPRSSWGTPISSAIACNGSSAATSRTKSPVPPASAAAVIRSARAVSAARRLAIARGVKPRDTIPRSLVCCGGSMLSMTNRCSSICSRVVPSWCRMIAVFSQVEYVSLSRETATMSACLVTAQNPSSSKGPGRCGFHQTGAVRRSSANSSWGTRAAYRSGSVRSKPGGSFGSATTASDS